MGDFNIREMMNKVLQENVFNKPLKKELISIFNDLVPMYVPSGHEDQMVEYAANVLDGAGFSVIVDTAGNIEAERGFTGTTKLVAINAHTDTVQGANDVGIEKGAGGALYNWMRDEFISEGYMIGGDDKCGVAVALCLAKHTDLPMKIVLTTGEETGGIGMKALRKEAWDNVAFCFTVDRMHGNDLISRYCGRPCAPKEFVTAFVKIAKSNVGVAYVDTSGSWADTAAISDYVPAVNLSAGYYNPHTNTDFIKCDEMYKTMMSVKAAIENQTEIELAIASAPADWQTVRAPYYGYEGYARGGWGGYYDDYDNWGTGTVTGTGASDAFNAGMQYGREGRGKTRAQRRGQSTLGTSFGGRKGKPKADYKKCRINFKGRDDKEEKIHIVEMNPDEEEVVSNYVEGMTTDAEWELLLLEGVITTPLFNVGLDLKIERKNNERIAEAAGKDDNDALLEIEEDVLEEEIQKCGFLPGSVEWTTYSDYLIGAIDYSDLQDYANNGVISHDLVQCAVKAKKRLGGTELGKELENWKKESREERENREEQEYHEELEAIGKGRENELSPFEQENLLEEFVDEDIDDAEWELYLRRGKISKSTYDAGFLERDLEWKKGGIKQKTNALIDKKTGKEIDKNDARIVIRDYSLGKITDKYWDNLYGTGQISLPEYREGIVAKKKHILGEPSGVAPEFKKREARQETLRLEGDPERKARIARQTNMFVEGKLLEKDWDRLRKQGLISKFEWDLGNARRRAYLSDKGTPLHSVVEQRPEVKGIYSASRMTAYIKEFVAGHISEAQWGLMFTAGTLSKGAYEEGFAKRKQYTKAKSPKLLRSDAIAKTMSKNDGLELVRQFALGAIDMVEWERMRRENEIPVWVYDRGLMERKHYINHGYFSDYMNTRTAPPKYKSFEPESEGVSCSVCEEQIERFVKDKISYPGWLVMRASGEISGDTFLRGLKKTPRYDITKAKKDLAEILSRYNKDFDTYEDQTDVR